MEIFWLLLGTLLAIAVGMPILGWWLIERKSAHPPLEDPRPRDLDPPQK